MDDVTAGRFEHVHLVDHLLGRRDRTERCDTEHRRDDRLLRGRLLLLLWLRLGLLYRLVQRVHLRLIADQAVDGLAVLEH